MHLDFTTAATFPPAGQGLKQIGELAAAFGLSSVIGLEREWRQKSAGLRTYTLVGTGAALMMLVSKYGFFDVLGSHVAFDPSRVAAQIVSGIGFIGAGLIFVRGDSVRGLTTAAVVWVTAGIGMACGAGLLLLAGFVTALHFVVMFGYPRVVRALPTSRSLTFVIQVVYEDGRGVLRDILSASTQLGYTIARFDTHRLERESHVSVDLEVSGRPAVEQLAIELDSLPGVVEVNARSATEE